MVWIVYNLVLLAGQLNGNILTSQGSARTTSLFFFLSFWFHILLILLNILKCNYLDILIIDNQPVSFYTQINAGIFQKT